MLSPTIITITTVLELIALGFFAGTLSGLLGVGGGVIVVPLLLIFYQYNLGMPNPDPHIATATSHGYILGAGLSGVWRHYRQRTVDPYVALALGFGAVPGALGGSLLAPYIPGLQIKMGFGLLMLVIAALFFFTKPPASGETKPAAPGTLTHMLTQSKVEEPTAGTDTLWRRTRRRTLASATYVYKVNFIPVALVGIVVGIFASIFGIGGGFLMVPFMSIVLRIPLPIAVGTSLLAIMATSTTSALSYTSQGLLDWTTALLLIVGGVVGAQVGARLVIVIPNKQLKIVFNIALILAAGYMIWSSKPK